MKKSINNRNIRFYWTHLINNLQQNIDYEVYRTKKDNIDFKLENITIFIMDITNTIEVNNIIKNKT